MKKLFSYLLISSMVVLSSCTNYDDQFDDLNSQINSLKSQIEGFSSLSSGLTALQGTVASLQTAIANIPVTPATDVSGLEANQAALQTGLSSLADAVAALQTKLEGAATAAEVAALQTALAAAQSDLTDLLAANNVYTPSADGLIINSAASLTVAESLGSRLAIVNGDVTVTNETANSMDATKLAEVVAKMGTITGKLTYVHSGTGVTSVDFTNLSSVGSLSVDQSAALSFPELATAGVVTLTLDNKVTSVSFPSLISVTSFNGDAISASKATSVDLGSLVRYGANLTITSDEGNVDLSSFVNTNADGVATSHSLTLVGAETLTAPLLTSGAVVADDLTSVDLPKWSFYPGSSFDSATTITLPSVTGQSTAASSVFDLTADAPKAETVNITTAAKVVSTALTTYMTFDAESHTSLKSLTLDGAIHDVNLASASKLDALVITGTANDVTISGTDLDELTLGYTPAAIKTDLASLSVNDNLSLTSFTGTLLNDLGTLSINGNTKLETLSLPALKTAGTTTAASVDIRDNKLVIDNIQQPTSGTTVPVVTKVIKSADFGPLKAYLDDAATQVGTKGSIKVVADDVLTSTSTTGVVTEDPTDEDDHIIMNVVMTVVANGTDPISQVEEFRISDELAASSGSQFKVNGLVSAITNTGGDLYYDLNTWATNATVKSNLTAAGVEVSVGKGYYEGSVTLDAATSVPTGTYMELVIDGETFTRTTAGTEEEGDIYTAMLALVNAGKDATENNKLTTTSSSSPKIVITGEAYGSGAAALSIGGYSMWTNISKITSVDTATETIVAPARITTEAYISVKTIAGGVDEALNATFTSVTATPLTISGTNTSVTATGDDETGVVAAKDSVGSTVSAATIKANRVDNTAFLAS